MPFVTEALWKAVTGGESVVIAEWPASTGRTLPPVAAQRISDMQKLVTEVRRFRSDQGLADRQKVPARLSGIDTADLDGQLPAVSSLAWLTDARDGFSPTASLEVRLSRGTVIVELDTSASVDVDAERRRLEKDLVAAQKELASTIARSSTTTRSWPRPPPRSSTRSVLVKNSRARKSNASRTAWAASDEPTARRPGGTVSPRAAPTPDEIASLLQVEHLLDQRWPETQIEPSLTRINALMELLGSPQRGYPSIHIAGTNGKTSVARIVDALLRALGRRTGRTTSPHLQSAVERIAIDGEPISPARYVEATARSSRSCSWWTSSRRAGLLGEPGPP